MLKVIGAILGIAVYIYFLVDVVRSSRAGSRALPKYVWLPVVVLIPLVGGIIWTAFGRPRNSSARHNLAPDDDPKFLRNLDEQAWREKMRKQREEES
ncbi:unannotated protein [freshwater metagenome]|uniref:Unannotated protein n=1 Tax=freshwater metagenome TaxID=449393 RepID=A0A6J7H2D8_9ZZZZ|nr:hypothetical protein [Actinomycetota bacterium]